MASSQRQRQRQRRANCQICTERESKYACPTCEVLYCSVPCYKEHKRSSCSASASANISIDTSTATADGNSMNEDMTRTRKKESFPPSASRVEEFGSRKRQPSAASRSSQPTSGSGTTSTERPLDSGGIFPPHVRQGELRSGGAGDIIDAENTRIDEDSFHLEMQKRVEGEDTRPVDEAGARLASGAGAGSSSGSAEPRSNPIRTSSPSSGVPTPRALRKLTSLKWPYVPDTPSYPDPLTRDDPKPLTLRQYESIARSPAIRRALSSSSSSPHAERLRALLRSLDALRGGARERAIERVLGVAPDQASSSSFVLAGAGLPPSSTLSSVGKDGLPEVVDEEDMRALRELAEAVEAAVRGVVGNPDAGFVGFGSGSDLLGLDWESMET